MLPKNELAVLRLTSLTSNTKLKIDIMVTPIAPGTRIILKWVWFIETIILALRDFANFVNRWSLRLEYDNRYLANGWRDFGRRCDWWLYAPNERAFTFGKTDWYNPYRRLY